MLNFHDHNVMVDVQKAHQQEALDIAHRQHMVRQGTSETPSLLQRIMGFRPAFNINLRAQLTRECTLNPAAC